MGENRESRESEEKGQRETTNYVTVRGQFRTMYEIPYLNKKFVDFIVLYKGGGKKPKPGLRNVKTSHAPT